MTRLKNEEKAKAKAKVKAKMALNDRVMSRTLVLA